VHVPDGFIDLTTSAGAAVAAAGGVTASVRAGAKRLSERQIPFAGLAAAFIFALQMLNFPVAAGTSGHLLGGALAAILLGPAMGVTVVTVVVVVQALLFADGGISALGVNVLNMAVITAIVGWAVFRAVSAVLPKRTVSLGIAVMVASWASVVASSIGFVAEYALGGRGGIDLGTVFGAMVGVHALIGIGEGLISVAVVGAVWAVRPDLVAGARRAGYPEGSFEAPGKGAIGGFVAGGIALAIALVVFVAPLASGDPDGLERVAIDSGIAQDAEDHAIGGPLADYSIEGLGSESLSTAASGTIGLIVTFAVGVIAVGVVRRRRPSGAEHR
jgi:cobalt/nickel transport system permease protein